MFSRSLGIKATRILLAGTVGFAALIGHATTAGATEPGAVIITFSVPTTPGAAQIPAVITHTINPTTPDERAAVYAQMIAARDEAAKGCGPKQVDLGEGEAWEAAQVGVPFPVNAEGTLSAIPGIVGTGTCDTPAPVPTPVTDAPLTPATVIDAPAAPSVPDATFETGTAIKLQRTFVVTALPNTGAHTVNLFALGGSLIAAGFLVVKLTRRTV